MKSVTADGSLLSPTGGVKGMNPAPHIHEHLRYTNMATALRTPSRITTSRLSTLRLMARTPQSTRTCTMRSSEHAAHRPLMHSVHIALLAQGLALCHPCHPCMRTCVWSLECPLPRVSLFLLPLPVPLPALPDVHLSAR